MRGRNNGGGGNNGNGRKGPNPLTRNYESNGPDVKIRGSAQQIAEKYTTLARDAQSAGDRVIAENYLQHAEHYNRIIAAAQGQMQHQHVHHSRDDVDDDSDQDREEFDNQGNVQPATAAAGGQEQEPELAAVSAEIHGSGPQPVIEGTPAEVALTAETAVETTEGRGRGRGRRPMRNQEQPAEKVEASAENEDAKAEDKAAAPRRGRRPRRGESPTAEDGAAGSEQVAPAAEPVDGDGVLAAVNG